MRKLACVFFGVVCLALEGCATLPRAAAAPAPHPYTRIANPDSNRVQLQIALRKFVPARRGGPVVWLAGVMHVGEPDYYRTLQHFLDAQTFVLYEGINPSAHPHHVHEVVAGSSQAPANSGYSMQSTLARSLGLVFQLEAIDYDRAHFLNSDLSIAQLQRIMGGFESSAGPGQKGGRNAPFDTLLQIMDGSSFLGSLFKLGLEFIATSPKLQAVAKLTLIEAIGRLKGDLSDVQGLPPEWKQLVKVLIEARNQNLMADLKEQLKKTPRAGSIAVFYGAGHMDDLERRVISELHYHAAEETWLTAFSVDMRQSGISPLEAQIMRNLIQSQVDQMQHN